MSDFYDGDFSINLNGRQLAERRMLTIGQKPKGSVNGGGSIVSDQRKQNFIWFRFVSTNQTGTARSREHYRKETA